MMLTRSHSALLLLLPSGALGGLMAQTQPPAQTEADAYTRYELLSPASGKFRILYDVTATAAGAHYYFNPIRKGSVASNESVIDPVTGRLLQFEAVDGATARTQGLPGADLETRYIRVELPRPVPAGGEIRIRIDKTYEDSKSYFEEAGEIVFTRSLGIKRNAVVLPPGYELVRCSVPSQVLTEADGRILVSFINANPDAASLTLRARKSSTGGAPAPAAIAGRLSERARQTREIVYFLQQPETHAFDLYHDYTETREGADQYLNVVRPGSTVSNPSAIILDTGERLETRFIKGEAITRAGLDIGEPVTPETEVVVIPFPKVQKGQSTRLRISETYTDSVRYRVEGDQLIWDRGFGRPFNAVVLPAGWALTHSAVPATVSLTADGRVRLDFVNQRLDEIQVLIVARRRSGAAPSGRGPEAKVSYDHSHMTGVTMSASVSKSQFKARALELFRQVERTGHSLVITDRGTPVLKLVPFREDPRAALRVLRDTVVKYDAPTEPVGEDDWESAR